MAKSMTPIAERISRNQSRVSVTPFVSIQPKALMSRLNLRAPEASQTSLSRALG